MVLSDTVITRSEEDFKIVSSEIDIQYFGCFLDFKIFVLRFDCFNLCLKINF